MGPPAPGSDDPLMTRYIAQGVATTEPRHLAVHEGGVGGAEGGAVHSEAISGARLEGDDYHIGGGAQFGDAAAAARRREVDREVPLAPGPHAMGGEPAQA